MDAVFKAYDDILKPKIESWLMMKLKVNSEQWIMEQCMLNLEKKINVKSFMTLNGGAIPCIFALSFGSNDTCCVYIDEKGNNTQEWFWPAINKYDSKEGKYFWVP